MKLRLALAVCLACAQAAWSQDLGTIGPTYPITEIDLLTQIKARLQSLMDSSEWPRLQAQAQDRLRQAVHQPTPLALARTHTPRSFTFDPSTTVERNLVDAQGRLIHPAGTSINPLSVVNLSKRLVFFDGRDPSQTRFVERLIRQDTVALTRWLLVATGGSPTELMKRWGRTVYFDQQGRLTQRLGITQVPALVRQDALTLRIDEVQP